MAFNLFSAPSFPNFNPFILQANEIYMINSHFSHFYNLLYYHVIFLILLNNTKLYSFLWLTEGALKKYFGNLFSFLGVSHRNKVME